MNYDEYYKRALELQRDKAQREREASVSSGDKWSKMIYGNTSTPYIDSYNRTASEMKELNEREVSDINKRRDEDLAKSNAGYDNTARQNWINYMQAQKKLPSQLNSLGIRGGASESSLLRLGTNYGTNVASNESARNQAANDIRSAYAQQVAEKNNALSSALLTAKTTAEQNQLNWEREQIDKDLQNFAGAIEGLYKSKKSYKKLIKKLKSSNDPNKDYKIMLARKAMNQLSSGGSSGGKSSGRRSGGYRSGGYGGGGDNNGNSNGGGSVTDNMNEYRKANYKKRTTTTKKKSSGYHIKGDSSTDWQ